MVIVGPSTRETLRMYNNVNRVHSQIGVHITRKESLEMQV